MFLAKLWDRFLDTHFFFGNSMFPSSTGPKLEARRKRWLQNCSRESLLEDFTKYIIYGIRGFSGRNTPVILREDVASFKVAFAAHAKSNKYWDIESLESYLLMHIPRDETSRALLKNAMPTLWALTTYFAQWPFADDSSAPRLTRLTLNPFIRALTFLCGRHGMMFELWCGDDSDFSRRDGNSDPTNVTDRPVLEYIFRALAVPMNNYKAEEILGSGPPDLEEVAASFSQDYLLRDVLDVMNSVQPVITDFTPKMSRDRLIPVATRLSLPAPPDIASLVIPSAVLMPLLELSISLLRHVRNFKPDEEEYTNLINLLETAGADLKRMDVGASFNTFVKWFGAKYDPQTYDAVALIFNVFRSPKILTDGIMVDFYTRKERRIYLRSLRLPGTGGDGFIFV